MCKKNIMDTVYIYPKKQKMAVLNDCIYKNLALILTRRIGDVEFFNGTVALEEGGMRINLKTTLIVYRAKTSPEELTAGSIVDIRPVWYECGITENGKPIADEFSWKEFKKFLPPGGNCI